MIDVDRNLGVSLIAGLEYGMDDEMEKWNGTVNIVAAKLCN